MAVFVCPECRKTVIRDAKEEKANVCPFCGGPMRVREPPPPLVEAVQTEPRPAPPAAARPARADAAPRKKKPADRDRPDEPPRRKRRRRKERPSAWAEIFDYPTIIYLACTGAAVLAWLVLIGVSLAAVHLGVAIIWFGAAVFLTGMVWLYIGALRDMDLPAIGPGMGGAGMALVLGGCAVLLIRVLVILVYGVLYTISNPYVAWKPALLTLLGIVMVISGLFFLAP
jgi:hypothetical protein